MDIFDTSNVYNTTKPIKGIKCSVENCAYNDGKNHCTANQVSVGPMNATSSTETVCATFRSY